MKELTNQVEASFNIEAIILRVDDDYKFVGIEVWRKDSECIYESWDLDNGMSQLYLSLIEVKEGKKLYQRHEIKSNRQ